MIAHRESRTLFLLENDVGVVGDCPCCGKSYRPNGTGPAAHPAITEALQHLPSEHVLGGAAPCFHDWAYLICPRGWAVSMCYGGHQVTAVDKDSADLGYLELMRLQVNRRASRLTRWWWRLQADRNYQAVHVGGDSAYCHGHQS